MQEIGCITKKCVNKNFCELTAILATYIIPILENKMKFAQFGNDDTLKRIFSAPMQIFRCQKN